MNSDQRRELIFSRRNQLQSEETTANVPWRGSNLLTNLYRLGFLVLVVGVLLAVWVVSNAHLTEQFYGAPVAAAGLIDPNAGRGALTPDNVERQILALSLRLRENDLALPAGADPRPRPFVITPGEPARFIAFRLQEAGFVRDADLFNLYLRVTGLDRRVDAGNFMLAETMTIPEVAEALQHALFEEALITIPEGFRLEEIADRLAENNIMEVDRFLAAVRQPRSLSIFGEYDFLQQLPPDASLEGYLFPDTYRLPVFASAPELLLRPFLDNFERKVGDQGLSWGSGGVSGHNLIILASIVEREAILAEERPLIASVYLNRLNGRCPDVGGNYLQADPTVQYARGTVGNWWWKPENIEEYKTVTSPFNTYLNPGLPPGPISSPGLNAIEATRNPATTGYCFFLATGDSGAHVFAASLAEHEANLRAYGYR